MAAIDNLNTAVQQLANDVQQLLNQPGSGVQDAQLQAIADSLNALDQQVRAKIGVVPTP
jgi:ElaB/YqjD/DUF883 family membrane-anchored ribosome-binding protein